MSAAPTQPWEAAPSAAVASADVTDRAGRLLGVADTELPAAAALDDATVNPTAPMIGGASMIWDDFAARFVRERANQTGTLLASATRTATNTTNGPANHNARGVLLSLVVTAAPGVETLTVSVNGGALTSSTLQIVSFTAFTTTGSKGYLVYPGATETIATAAIETDSMPIPRNWSVTITHSAGGNWTYSLDYALIR